MGSRPFKKRAATIIIMDAPWDAPSTALLSELNIRAIYTRKNKTRLSLDASEIRLKLSRINGTFRLKFS